MTPADLSEGRRLRERAEKAEAELARLRHDLDNAHAACMKALDSLEASAKRCAALEAELKRLREENKQLREFRATTLKM